MQRRSVLHALTVLATLGGSLAAAQAGPARVLRFEAQSGGQYALLQLRVNGVQVGGTLHEGPVRLDLRGQITGRRVQGQLFLAGAAAPVAAFDGDLQADQLEATLRPARGGEPTRLLMRRVGASAPATPTGGVLDTQLLGRWQHQTMTNSSGGGSGSASFTTLRTLVLSADGRVQQTMRSVGGGAGWSHRSGEELEFTGRWLTRRGEFWVLVDGQAAFQHSGRYERVDGRLILEGGGNRQIWRR